MTTPFPQQPPAPLPSKKRKWPWIVGAIVALIVVVSALSDDTKTSAPHEASASQSQAAHLNTPVRDGKFEFVVKSVQPGLSEVGDNPFLAQKAQGQFVIVALSVQNIGDNPQSFSPSDQKLTDTQGRSFISDSAAQIALGGSDISVWDNINPGNTVDVKIVYDMPAGATPASIALHDSMFSGGATVTLTP